MGWVNILIQTGLKKKIIKGVNGFLRKFDWAITQFSPYMAPPLIMLNNLDAFLLVINKEICKQMR